jgi:hypothetical protein
MKNKSGVQNSSWGKRLRSALPRSPVRYMRASRGCGGGGGRSASKSLVMLSAEKNTRVHAAGPHALRRTAAPPKSRCGNVLRCWIVRRVEPLGIGCMGCRWTERCISGFLSSIRCRQRELWVDCSLVGGWKFVRFPSSNSSADWTGRFICRWLWFLLSVGKILRSEHSHTRWCWLWISLIIPSQIGKSWSNEIPA